MDFLLVTVISLGIFVGYNAQPAGNLNFACRNGEEYDMCRSPCEPTCSSIRSGIKINCTQTCKAGCFCRNGFVRASDKSCVIPEECARRDIPSCKENEEYQECGSPCVVNCSNINDPIFCTKPCHSGCFCKPEFVRNSLGHCVHPRNCLADGTIHCPVNEQYVSCVNYCNTCWENPDCKNRYCNPGCDCKPGFYRSVFGQCVTFDECLSKLYDSAYQDFPGNCGENEIYTDCVNMCNDCISRGRCDFEYYCEPGCDCKPNHYRDERGICVPEQFCYRRCNDDQLFSSCGPSCVSTCRNYKQLLYHPCKQDCVPGCFCPRNLVIGPNGRCIQPKYCPPERPECPPDEQYYVCIPTCHATCKTFNDSSEICDVSCTKGCYCKGGLIRNDDGKCVLPRDCPARNPTCPPGEAFYQCLPTCRTTCDSLNKTTGLCSTECTPGCFCQPGLVRNKDGKCVRPQECIAKPRCPPGEIHYNCVPTCRNSCENLNSSRPCVRTCFPGCFCQRGFVRSPDGKCVRPRNCPPVCRANEVFLTCGTACPPTCFDCREKRVCSGRCIKGCFCKPGFVLGPNRRCILPVNCPRSPLIPGPGGFGGRRGGADEGNSTGETTETTLATEGTQSSTNESTQTSNQDTTSTGPESTKISTPAAAETSPASTDKASTATDPVSSAADSANDTSTQISTGKTENSQTETTPMANSTKVSSESTVAGITSSATNAAETDQNTQISGQTVAANTEAATTDSTNSTSINTTV